MRNYSALDEIGIIANDRHLSRVPDASFASMDRSVRMLYTYAYTWEYWFHRVSCLLACLLARLLSAYARRVSVSLPHSNPHSRALPRDRAQVTGLGYRCSGVPDTFQCIGFTKETDIAIPILPIARSRFNPSKTRNSSFSRGISTKLSRNIILPRHVSI